MTYEDAKRIVEAVAEQKRAANYHREAYDWLKIAIGGDNEYF